MALLIIFFCVRIYNVTPRGVRAIVILVMSDIGIMRTFFFTFLKTQALLINP